MKIKNVILSKSYTGFYFDDQKAIKQGAGHDGFMYLGDPATEGFSKIRQTGEAISIQLVLEDGSVGHLPPLHQTVYGISRRNASGKSEFFFVKNGKFSPIYTLFPYLKRMF